MVLWLLALVVLLVNSVVLFVLWCVFCIRFYDFLFGCMFATISVCLSGGFGFG